MLKSGLQSSDLFFSFLFPLLQCSQTGNHQQKKKISEEFWLNRPDMKVKS
jgi:hypothetical protein